MRGDHTQWPPITRRTRPSWAKQLMPRVLRSPMPSACSNVRSRGPPVSRKRRSTAPNNAAASSRPPPLPDSPTVSPSRMSATASAAETNLSRDIRQLTRMRSVKPRRAATVDRDRGALDVACPLGAQEQGELGRVLRLADPAQPVLGERLGADFVRRDAHRFGTLLEQLHDPRGLGDARMDGVDVDAVALAEPRHALRKI